jgi:aspartate aminotransferase-like enzyme
MKNMLDGIEDVLLMGPGPSSVYPAVYKALSRSTLGYLDAYFIQIMDEIKALLQKLMKTRNELTLAISGTGMAGMETCLVNLLEPGDAILILINGVFGARMREIATRLGADVDVLEFEWGTPVQPEAVQTKLNKRTYKLVAMVHAETSTGVRNPAQEIGQLLKGTESLYLLDAVTSLGGIEVDVVSGYFLLESGKGHRKPENQNSELLPGHRFDRQVLGWREAGLPPHRPDEYVLWIVSSPAAGHGRGPGEGGRPSPEGA